MASNEHDTKSKTDTAQSELPIEWNERDSMQPIQQMTLRKQSNRQSR